MGVIASDIINVFFSLNYAFIMTLRNNDSKATNTFVYVFSILCLLGHLVFGIMMLVTDNDEITRKRVLWSL